MFFSSRPAGRESATAPMLLGQPGFASGFSSWEKPHARTVLRREPTSRSQAPAASSLEFFLFFWVVSLPPRWRLYGPQRRVYTRRVRPPPLGCVEGSARNKLILCIWACDALALYTPCASSLSGAGPRKRLPTTPSTAGNILTHRWPAPTAAAIDLTCPPLAVSTAKYRVTSRFPRAHK